MRDMLVMRWSKRKNSHVIVCPDQADGDLVRWAFQGDLCRVRAKDDQSTPCDISFFKELEARGYDLATLRFSVEKKARFDGEPR